MEYALGMPDWECLYCCLRLLCCLRATWESAVRMCHWVGQHCTRGVGTRLGVMPGWAHRGAVASALACGDASAKVHPIALGSADRNYGVS